MFLGPILASAGTAWLMSRGGDGRGRSDGHGCHRARFDSLIGFVLEHEAGINHPADRGGPTKYGISLRAYPHLGEKGIRDLTKQGAADFYYRDWWTPMRCREINDDKVAQKYLDTCVNMGISGGTRVLQRALCSIGHRVTVDGKIGPQTPVRSTRQTRLSHPAMRRCQAERYAEIIRNDPSQKV